MDFKINGENKELNFGVKFVAEIDETEKYDADGISFGMGLMLVEKKLEMGSLGALAKVIEKALHKENVLTDEVYAALDEYEAEELENLFEKVENELKNSNAVRAAKARMEKQTKQANRKQAAKPTKK